MLVFFEITIKKKTTYLKLYIFEYFYFVAKYIIEIYIYSSNERPFSNSISI